MTDALAALLDVVGLDVRYGREVHDAEGDWALDLPASSDLRWVASSTHTTVWVAWHGGDELVRPGSALLVPARDVGTRSGKGTGAGAGTGVRVGTVAVLRDEPPAYLTDSGLLRCIDALFADTGTCGSTGLGPGPGPESGGSAARSVADVLRTTVRGSRRTAERRFRATTGCTPDALRRWFLSLRVRRALDDGLDEESVATAFGFARASSMRRALARVTPPRTDRPADPWVLPREATMDRARDDLGARSSGIRHRDRHGRRASCRRRRAPETVVVAASR